MCVCVCVGACTIEKKAFTICLCVSHLSVLFVQFLSQFHSILQLLELGHKKPIHVMDVWVISTCEFQRAVIFMTTIGGEAELTKWRTSWNKFHMTSSESIVDYLLL